MLHSSSSGGSPETIADSWKMGRAGGKVSLLAFFDQLPLTHMIDHVLVVQRSRDFFEHCFAPLLLPHEQNSVAGSLADGEGVLWLVPVPDASESDLGNTNFSIRAV